MILADVYSSTGAPEALYELLKQRSGSHSISHRAVPEFAEHLSFVNSRPYRYWYLVATEETVIGSVYITENNEVGLFLNQGFEHLQADALRLTVSIHVPLPAIKSKRVAAFSINANPKNTHLITAIESAGGTHVQNTYLMPLSDY